MNIQSINTHLIVETFVLIKEFNLSGYDGITLYFKDGTSTNFEGIDNELFFNDMVKQSEITYILINFPNKGTLTTHFGTDFSLKYSLIFEKQDTLLKKWNEA